jgi:cytochrome c peroxidase
MTMSKLLSRKMWLSVGLGVATVAATVGANPSDPFDQRSRFRAAFDKGVRYSSEVLFPEHVAVGANADPTRGQAKFGLAPDEDTLDATLALFQGVSHVEGQTVVSNGKSCASCHRGEVNNYGLPPLPLHSSIPSGDPVFNVTPEDGADPLGSQLFDEHGLVISRPGRFNPLLPSDSPFRTAIFWRKTQRLINVGLTHGMLTDGRSREMIEQARGAVFNHTQDTDVRFDDLPNAGTQLRDIAAYQEGLLSQPELAALYNPLDPTYPTLVNNPYATVSLTTDAQRRGKDVFNNNCFACHNMPNVFGNRDHVDGPPLGYPPAYDHNFDVGVAQRNALHLDYRRWNATTQQRETVVIPLVRLDGLVVNWPIADDIGLAASSARFEDLHRFKVPQLRRIKDLGPYFHDNSAATLEEVVDFFNSPAYNQSEDGKQHPIRMNSHERSDLLAFLRAL